MAHKTTAFFGGPRMSFSFISSLKKHENETKQEGKSCHWPAADI